MPGTQIGPRSLYLRVAFPCLSAALLALGASHAPRPASIMVGKPCACALAGRAGRVASLETRRWFFLLGVGLFSSCLCPDALAGFWRRGVLSGACGRSFRFFARVALALAARDAARAAMFTAAFASLSIASCSGAGRVLMRRVRGFSAAHAALCVACWRGLRPLPARRSVTRSGWAAARARLGSACRFAWCC